MGFKCSVFGCRGNYTSQDKVSVFKFPKNPDLAKIWASRTMRENFKVTSSSRICEHHFRKEDVLREAEFFDERSGRLLKSTLMYPKLKEDSVPLLMTNCPTCVPPRKRKIKLEDKNVVKASEASSSSDLEYQKRVKIVTMASNVALPSSGIEIHEKEVNLDDEPSTSKSAIEVQEDIIERDVEGSDLPSYISNNFCKLKIKIDSTQEGIIDLSVESPDVDNSVPHEIFSSKEVHTILESKIRENLKNEQTNKLIKLYKRSVELKEILMEKNAEYLKIQKLMEMIFRNQEKFLRQQGVVPKIPMYSRGISVDLPFLSPCESLNLPKLFLDLNAAQNKPVAAAPPRPPPPPYQSPAVPNASTSSASNVKESIECIDLTEDPDNANKIPKAPGSTSTVSHPAPFPPRPYVAPDDNFLKIPPRPRLKVKADAQGIILQWDMPSIYNTKGFAPVIAYEIFGYQVVPKHKVCNLLWKKIGTVKAMTLPMACTLTQFQEGNKYFFAIRAMDAHNRCSHFSEALSIVYNSRNKTMAPRREKIAVPLIVEAKSRGAKYFQRMKMSDPERYKCHLSKEAARNKMMRSQLSEEKRKIQREQARIRVLKFRGKEISEKRSVVRKEFKKKIKDMTPSELKDYNRVRRAESRNRMTHQKSLRKRKEI